MTVFHQIGIHFRNDFVPPIENSLEMTVSLQIEKSLEITVSHQIEKSLEMTVSQQIEKSFKNDCVPPNWETF